LTPGTSIINPAEVPPKLPPDRLIKRWPHEGHPALEKYPIPLPSQEKLKLMQAEAQKLKHDTPLDNSPRCKQWVIRVHKGFQDLVQETGANQQDVYMRFRSGLRRWKKLCSHLTTQIADRRLNIIKHGYSINWLPEVRVDSLRHDCKRNPPTMKTRVDKTWMTFDKMLASGTQPKMGQQQSYRDTSTRCKDAQRRVSTVNAMEDSSSHLKA
jgi:hypothetical protein